jgi:hypothetical protein
VVVTGGLMVFPGVAGAQAAPRAFGRAVAARLEVRGQLTGVSCTSPSACMAVGNVGVGSPRPVSVADRWNGSKWTGEPLPARALVRGSSLAGVSCVSRAACFAVGSYEPRATVAPRALVMFWNGSSWRVVRTPSPAGSGLSSVSCVSVKACVAVGGAFERWDGRRWSRRAAVAVGRYGELTSVSCATTRACTAVGYVGKLSYGRAIATGTLAARWRGGRWTVEPTPDSAAGPADAELAGVSCPSATTCTAVGAENGQTLAERWNGARWSVQPMPAAPTPPNPDLLGITSALTAIACRSSAACTAVGSYSLLNCLPGPEACTPSLAQSAAAVGLVEAWNGARWSVTKGLRFSDTGAIAGATTLAAASCVSAVCMAVGEEGLEGPPAAERFDHRRWSVVRVPTATR